MDQMDGTEALRLVRESIAVHEANPRIWVRNRWYQRPGRYCILGGAAALHLAKQGSFKESEVFRTGEKITTLLDLWSVFEALCEARSAKAAICILRLKGI